MRRDGRISRSSGFEQRENWYHLFSCLHMMNLLSESPVIRHEDLFYFALDGVWGEPAEGQANVHGPLWGVRQGQNSNQPSWGRGRRVNCQVPGQEKAPGGRSSQQGSYHYLQLHCFFETLIWQLLTMCWSYVPEGINVDFHLYVEVWMYLFGYDNLTANDTCDLKKETKQRIKSANKREFVHVCVGRWGGSHIQDMYSRCYCSDDGPGAHEGHSAAPAAGRHQAERPDPALGQNKQTILTSYHLSPAFIAWAFISISFNRRPSHTTSSCTCRQLPCPSITRLCVRAVSCMTQASSTPPTCETCSCQTTRWFTTHLKPTHPPAHHHSKSFD